MLSIKWLTSDIAGIDSRRTPNRVSLEQLHSQDHNLKFREDNLRTAKPGKPQVRRTTVHRSVKYKTKMKYMYVANDTHQCNSLNSRFFVYISITLNKIEYS